MHEATIVQICQAIEDITYLRRNLSDTIITHPVDFTHKTPQPARIPAHGKAGLQIRLLLPQRLRQDQNFSVRIITPLGRGVHLGAYHCNDFLGTGRRSRSLDILVQTMKKRYDALLFFGCQSALVA